ncbi:MAG TPA: hypothetical protein VGF99_12510 [Myxococcota bacterium]
MQHNSGGAGDVGGQALVDEGVSVALVVLGVERRPRGAPAGKRRQQRRRRRRPYRQRRHGAAGDLARGNCLVASW